VARTKGSSNVVPFGKRKSVETTSSQDVLHLAKQVELTCLGQFEALLNNQQNFLRWIDTRHKDLAAAKAALSSNARGPKDATYRKYRWYTEQQSLLEAINGFEVFYKATLVALADCIHDYVSPNQIKGAVDAKVLWATQQGVKLTDLIFEHRLFHNPDQVDEATSMLVGAKRYNASNTKSPMFATVTALQAVFQIRHTLSHNQGRVTQSDSAKFASLGFKARAGEVLDPGKNYFGAAIRDILRLEAKEFTSWLLAKTADHLKDCSTSKTLQGAHRDAIAKRLGSTPGLLSLNWK
jgi:hypothetical protein